MSFLETASDDVYSGLFVDLYVRCTNSIAIDLYEGLGYSVYRRVREYYGSFGLGPGGKDEEDAFGPFPPFLSFLLDLRVEF
jgi:N-terminal acetyltransferase B complex catalytic subunit